MNFLRNMSFKRKIAAAVCAFLACAAVIAGALFAATGAVGPNKNGANGSGNRVEAEVPAEAAVKITPYRNYTAVSSAELYDAGVVVYENETTVADLKSNLEVVAEYTNGTASGSAALLPEEYTVNVFGTQKPDNAIVAPAGGGSMINVSVTVNGIASREFTVAVEEASEIRKYTGVSAKVTGNITEDMDKTAVKSAIEVTGTYEITADDGTVSAATEVIKNRELFSVADLSLTVGSNNTITVILSDDATVSDTISDVTVAKKELKEATLLVKADGFRRNEKGANLYEKEIDGKWYSAFVAKATTTRADVFDNLEIRAIYSNSAEVLSFEWNNTDEATAGNGIKLNFNGLPDFTSAGTKTLNVRVGNFSAGIVLQFETSHIIEIKAKDNTERTDLYPYTLADSSFFTDKVIARFNDGMWDETNPLTGYTVEGSLAPTKDDIEACINFTAGTYFKELTISYSSELTNNITLTAKAKVNVNRAEITDISAVALPTSRRFPDQKYKTEVNYSGLTVIFSFGLMNEAVAYLDDFKNTDYIQTKFYKNIVSGTPTEEFTPKDNKITHDVKVISVSFKEFGGTGYTKPVYGILNTNLTINKYEVGLPTVNTTDVPFTEGVSKDIVFAQDENLGENFVKENISVALFAKEDDCKNLSNVGSSSLTVGGKELARYENGKVNFFAGGETYYIRVQIKDTNSLHEEVKWAGLTGSNATAIDDYTIYYSVTVNRGALTVSFEYDKEQWTYGDNTPALTVKGTTSSGQTYILKNTSSAAGSGEIAVPYTVNYYLINSDGSVSETPSAGRLAAGRYKVVVRTAQTDAYIAGTSAQDTVITVTPRQLSIQDGEHSKYYERKDFYIKDFLADGIGNLADGDNVEDVINISELNSTPYRHKGDYSVNLVIKDDNKNYCWASDATSVKFDFSIKARELALKVENIDGNADFEYSASFTASKLNFTYTDNGNASQTPQATFYAKLKSPVFYTKTDFEGKKENPLAIEDAGKWSVGDYVVYYSTSSGDSADNEDDYNLPSAYAEFKVTRKAIAKVTSAQDGAKGAYNRVSKDISLTNWTAENDNSGTPILTRSLSAKYFDKDGAQTEFFSNLSEDNSTYGVTFAGENVGVTHAGVYTLTVTLNSNYKWQSEAGEDIAPVVIGYTVNQAKMAAESTFTWGELAFTFDTAAQYPVPSAFGIAHDDGIRLSVKYYQADGETEITDPDTIKASGDYVVKVAGWYVTENETGWSCAANYKADKELKTTFTIQSANLVKPTLKGGTSDGENRVKVTYKGEAYGFNEFIKQYDETGDSGYAYGSGQHKIVIYAKSADNSNGVAVNDGMQMTDVCTYNVYVYPAPNFKWGDGVGASPISVDGIPDGTTGFTFTFKIEPFMLDASAFKWYAEDKTEIAADKYTGYTYNNKTRALVSKVDGAVFASDSGKVGVDVTYNNTDRKNAGTVYTATANGLSGDRAFNYSMPETKPTKQFEIQKKALSSFSVSAGSAEFDNAEHTATLTYADGEYFTQNAITLTDVFNYGFRHKFDYTGAEETELTENGFSYTNAGVYTVTLTLKDTVNFTFDEASESFTISPKSVDAPVFQENNRAHEYDKDNMAFTPEFNVSGDIARNIEYKYGKCTADGVIDGTFTPQNNTENLQQPGQYYVILKLTDADGFIAYNFTINNTKYPADNYVKGADSVHYDADGVYVIQHYAITNTQLDISFTANGYDFGDNAFDADNRKGIADLITKSGYGVNIVFNADGTVAADVSVNYRFKALNSDAEVELVNGIPWEAGKYTVTVSVTFSNDKSTYEPINTELEFTVSPRVVSVAWSGGSDSAVSGSGNAWAATYDGKTHTLTATITNMPKKSESDTAAAPTLTVTGAGKDFKDGGYALTAAIDGDSDGAGNFTVEGADFSATLTINKRAVEITLAGSSLTGVYGNAVDYTSAAWAYVGTNKFLVVNGDGVSDFETYTGVNDFFGYVLYDGENIVDSSTPVAKVYSLGARLKASTNYTLTVTNGRYEITPREITVSLNENAGAVYAENVSLNGCYTVTYNGGDTWLVSGDGESEVFTLALDTNLTEWLPVGEYAVLLTNKNNGNYKILNSSNKLGTFTVNPAVITGAAATANAGKVYNAQHYNVISVDNSGLINVAATVLNEQPVKWYWMEKTADSSPAAPTYNKDGYADGWEEITTKTLKNAFAQTDYWIMVAAANHNPQVIADPVTVEIAKATLTLTVNFKGDNAIYYGEAFVAVSDGASITKYFEAVSGLCVGDDIASLSGLSGAYDYSAADYSAGKDITSDEDYYTIDLGGTLSSTNYVINYKNGELEVKPLPVTVIIKNQTLPYMSSTLDNITDLQALLNGYVSVTTQKLNGQLPDELSCILNIKSPALATSEENKVITVTAGEYPIYAVQGEKYGNYDCTFTVEGDEYSGSYSYPAEKVGKVGIFNIVKTSNRFTGHFDFANKTAKPEMPQVTADAWIYGIYDATNHTQGYNIYGGQKITAPTTLFTHKSGYMQYTLYFGETQIGSDQDVFELFANATSNGLFNAGEYRLEYTYKGDGVNFGDTDTEVRFFKVGVRDLYVYAENGQTYYGEEFAPTATANGLVFNGNVTDTLSDIMTIEFDVSGYVKGGDAKEYGLSVVKVKAIENSNCANYNVITNKISASEEAASVLTVNPRPVSIEILAKENRYDFNKTWVGAQSGYVEEQAQTLEFTATSGEGLTGTPFYGVAHTDKYNNENCGNIVELVTNALDGENGKGTGNLGNYLILALYGEGAGGNYAITVTTAYERDEEKEGKVQSYFNYNHFTYKVENYFNVQSNPISIKDGDGFTAGTYKIEPAYLAISLGNNTFTYDGKEKEITITYTGSDTDSDSIYAEYFIGGRYTSKKPVNVGNYPFRITVANPDYAYNANAGTTMSLTINRRQIGWNVSINGSTTPFAGSDGAVYGGNDEYKYLGIEADGAKRFNNLSVLFANLGEIADADKFGLTYEISTQKIVTYGDGSFNPFADGNHSGEYSLSANKFDFSAHNAGRYTVTLTLGDKENNYTFGNTTAWDSTNTTSFTFTFVISQATVNVVTKAGWVQYGTPLTANGTATARFGGFTLSDYVLDLMNIENTAMSGSFDISKVTYSVAGYNPAETPVGTSGLYIGASGISAYNYDFTYNTGTEQRGILTVSPREITVNIHGSNDGNTYASAVYSGIEQTPDFEKYFADYFKPQGDWYGQTADNTKNYATVFTTDIVISGGAKTDVGVYPLRLQVGASNYNITYLTANGVELYKGGKELSVDDKDRPTFEITKKWLTVQAGSKGMRGDKQFATAFDITYGNKTDGYFKVEFNGFVNGEAFGTAAENSGSALEFTADRGGVAYAPWESHAGEKYIVTPSGLDFRNYKIADENGGNGWLTATMTVVSRLVTATTEDRTYAEMDDNGTVKFNKGEYGRKHDAQIIFTDSSAAEINNSIDYYGLENGNVVKDEYGVIKTIKEYAPNLQDGFKRSYAGRTFGNAEYSGTAAPDKAGEYEVIVALTGDYILADGTVTLAYRVEKKVISLNWNKVSDDYLQFNAGDDKQRILENYIDDIMRVVNVTNTYKGADGKEITDTLDRNTDGTLSGKQWRMGDDGRSIILNIYGIGLYTSTVEIIASAQNNYKWKDSETETLSVAFRVAANGFRITGLTLGTGIWTYGTAAPEPTFELDIVGISIGLVYQYANLNSLPGEFDEADGYGKMLALDAALKDELESIRGGYSASAPTRAGIYLLRAYYTGSDEYREAEAYLIFKIEQAIVSAPQITDGKLTDTYTGDVLSLAFGYDATLLTIAYDGTMSVTPDGIAVHATEADTDGYVITFTLKDDKNYRWADGAQSSFKWIINPAEDNEITAFDASVLADLTYTGQPAPLPEAEAKYGGEVYFEFLSDGEWTREIPVKAGKYSVRAVSAKTGNYSAGGNDAFSKEQSFVIKRAQLTVTPSGSAVYGTAFDETGAGYALSYAGFVDGEKPVIGSPVFRLESAPEKLVVGSYGLNLGTVEENPSETVDGVARTVVSGLSLENYYISVSGGSFEVTKKQLSAVIGNVNAVYGDKFDLSGAKIALMNSEFAYDDEFDSLDIVLNINSSNQIPDPEKTKYQAGAYPMAVASYNGANYEVAFPVIGAYVVSALDIMIEIGMTDGVYGAVAPTAEVAGVTTEDGKALGEISGIIQPKFTFVYYGVSNNGEWSFGELDENTVLPALAGAYTAKAVGTFTRNFNLVNTPAQSFVINKAEIDANGIKTVNGVYTGSPLTPVIADNDYVGLYEMLPVTYTDAGVWNVTLKLKDFYNYKWVSVDVDERAIPFTIEKGDNAFIKDGDGNDVTIAGWTYGQKANAPTATTRFGSAADYTFEYSSAKDGDFTVNVPVSAGTWWVRATVRQADNYNSAVSEAVAFVIEKAALSAPSLGIISDGDGKNTVYTGERLEAAVNGFNHSTMRIIYAGDISSAGDKLSVFAVGAATYKVNFALNDGANYRWADGVTVENGEAVLEWTVARKQIAKPVMNDKTYMVNGRTLEFIPDGFDESTMTIEGNKTSYGGTFKVTVSIKDKNNYEWADSSVEDITFDWKVVGWDTVFVIVASVLGVIAGAAAIAIGVQYLLHVKRKKAEALQAAATERAVAEPVAENAQSAHGEKEASESEVQGAEQPEVSGGESAADEATKEEDGNV